MISKKVKLKNLTGRRVDENLFQASKSGKVSNTITSLNKNFWNYYNVPGTILSAMDTTVNKKEFSKIWHC